MNYFFNVKFNMIKENLAEGILKKIYDIVTYYKNCFLNDVSYFNSILSFSTRINFFNEEDTLNLHGSINFKSLTIEDFIYRSLDEIMFDIKICLKQTLNELEEKNHLNFYKFDVIHATNVNITQKNL